MNSIIWEARIMAMISSPIITTSIKDKVTDKGKIKTCIGLLTCKIKGLNKRRENPVYKKH